MVLSVASVLNAGPLPTQVCTWLPERSDFAASAEDPAGARPQWLYCLRHTAPGDRQVVWSGVHGPGIVAVVDFSGEVRPRQRRESSGRSRLYEGWGVIARLNEPISVDRVLRDPVMKRVFGRSIQGVKSIEPEAASAIAAASGGLPGPAAFTEPADWRDRGGDWSGQRLPPEVLVEQLVLDRSRLARRIGFPSRVNPGGKKQRLLNGRYPDLWCTDGVVGDAKNQVTAAWGPGQIEDYIDQCQLEWPEHRWRGLLVQGEPEMAPNALPRLRSSRHADRIEVWAVRRKCLRLETKRLYP